MQFSTLALRSRESGSETSEAVARSPKFLFGEGGLDWGRVRPGGNGAAATPTGFARDYVGPQQSSRKEGRHRTETASFSWFLRDFKADINLKGYLDLPSFFFVKFVSLSYLTCIIIINSPE